MAARQISRSNATRKKRHSLLSFIWAYVQVNLSTAMEYRVNFILQSIGMFVNDLIWMVLWLVFFTKFNSLNTWTMQDMYMLYAVLTIAYGLVGIFFGNFTQIANMIRDGYLDFYLSLPKEELTHLLASRSRFSAVGDFVFGIVLFAVFLSPEKWPLAAFLCIVSSIVVLAFSILLGALSFYIGSASSIAKYGFESMVGFASYPSSIYSGFTKFLLLFIIPAGFVTGVPVLLLKQFDLAWFLGMICFAILLFCVAVFVFKKGVKRYESGSMINVRT